MNNLFNFVLFYTALLNFEEMDILLAALIYTIATLIITYLAWKKRISWKKAFLLSLLLTPFAGAIYYSNTHILYTYKEARYKCQRCGFYFTTEAEYCPHCAKDGVKVPLIKTYATMT